MFEGQYYPGTGAGGRAYDVSRDGERFLMIKDGTATDARGAFQINVVLNWFEELKARVPVP